MPIIKTTAYKTDDDKTFATIEEAQRHDLEALCKTCEAKDEVALAFFIMENRERIAGILSATGRKPRRKNAKKAATPKA